MILKTAKRKNYFPAIRPTYFKSPPVKQHNARDRILKIDLFGTSSAILPSMERANVKIRLS